MTFQNIPGTTSNTQLKRTYAPQPPRPVTPKPQRKKSPGELQLEALQGGK